MKTEKENKEKFCRLCGYSHSPDFCPCCCFKCGQEKDAEGFCPNYCIDNESGINDFERKCSKCAGHLGIQNPEDICYTCSLISTEGN